MGLDSDLWHHGDISIKKLFKSFYCLRTLKVPKAWKNVNLILISRKAMSMILKKTALSAYPVFCINYLLK